jgi:hypothetical protein
MITVPVFTGSGIPDYYCFKVLNFRYGKNLVLKSKEPCIQQGSLFYWPVKLCYSVSVLAGSSLSTAGSSAGTTSVAGASSADAVSSASVVSSAGAASSATGSFT